MEFLLQMLTEKCAPPNLSVFVLVSTPKILIELSVLGFILVYARVRRVTNKYIIFNITKNNYFPYTSALTLLNMPFIILIQSTYLYI